MVSFVVSTDQVKAFSRTLLRWYRKFGRDLPWRHTQDPYHILVAEVMLQQTQVTTVIERYQRWFKRFPTIAALAKAESAAVLKEWSGLGYNRRVLALQQIAQRVMTEFRGKFPADIATLKSFNGIGDYTAHALASFAFQQRVPLVDTNIKRVLGRIFFGYKKLEKIRDDHEQFWELSRKVIDRTSSPYDLNQGLMDFGAIVCTAKQPRCHVCPMQTICRSYPAILQAQPEHLRVKTKRHEPLYYGQPRRIWRGKILQYLHTQPKGATLQAIGRHLQADWQDSRLEWLDSVIRTMIKDQLIQTKGNRFQV
jgi:A/G-specific adenine glycosylase